MVKSLHDTKQSDRVDIMHIDSSALMGSADCPYKGEITSIKNFTLDSYIDLVTNFNWNYMYFHDACSWCMFSYTQALLKQEMSAQVHGEQNSAGSHAEIQFYLPSGEFKKKLNKLFNWIWRNSCKSLFSCIKGDSLFTWTLCPGQGCQFGWFSSHLGRFDLDCAG